MKKMPCLFVRDFHGHNSFTIREEVTPGCEWVLAGEGAATRKWDGTACAVIKGVLYKRYDAKKGKSAPSGATPCDEPDPVTGHHPHWVPVGGEPESKWHQSAFLGRSNPFEDGTYELVGPKINDNRDKMLGHLLLPHGEDKHDVHRTFEGIKLFLEEHPFEGLVFHHSDGRMCKIRRADFGLPWPPKP